MEWSVISLGKASFEIKNLRTRLTQILSFPPGCVRTPRNQEEPPSGSTHVQPWPWPWPCPTRPQTGSFSGLCLISFNKLVLKPEAEFSHRERNHGGALSSKPEQAGPIHPWKLIETLSKQGQELAATVVQLWKTLNFVLVSAQEATTLNFSISNQTAAGVSFQK